MVGAIFPLTSDALTPLMDVVAIAVVVGSMGNMDDIFDDGISEMGISNADVSIMLVDCDNSRGGGSRMAGTRRIKSNTDVLAPIAP